MKNEATETSTSNNKAPRKRRVCAAARSLGRFDLHLSTPEFRLFVLIMSMIDRSEPCPETLTLDKEAVAEAIGISTDRNKSDHVSSSLKRAIGGIAEHSRIVIADGQEQQLIDGIAFSRGKIEIRLNQTLRPLISNLKTTDGYMAMDADAMMAMHTSRAVALYLRLSSFSDTRLTCTRTLSADSIKSMLGIDPDAYIKDGSLDYGKFKKAVIDTTIKDLNEHAGSSMHIECCDQVRDGNGGYAYRFKWRCVSVRKASKVEKTVKEKASFTLAKDVSKNRKPNVKKNGFCDFEQRNYDYEALEKQLILSK